MEPRNSGFEVVGDLLVHEGVDTLFGLMGEANAGLIGHCVQRHGVRYISTRHEGGAVGMAEGYARASGRIGVATVTYGPGVTNALTAITSAARNRAQVLVVTGQREPGLRSRNQFIDQAAMLAPTGAGIFAIYRPSDIEAGVAAAMSFIRREARPAVINLSVEMAEGRLEEGWRAEAAPPAATTGPIPLAMPDETQVLAAASILAEARRPVVIAGRGAVSDDGVAAIVRLAEASNAALMTSLLAKGSFHGHALDRGIAGGFGTAAGQACLEEADVVVAFGASLNLWTTRLGKGFPKAQLIHVDTDAEAFANAVIKAEIALEGDAGLTADALREGLTRGSRSQENWPANMAEPALNHDESRPLHPGALCERLDKILPEARTISLDAGHFFEYPARHLRAPDARGFLFTAGFGSIGLGLATAIGAALGRPDRLSVAMLGDGGFLMSLAELETAVRYRIPMLVVVMNDNAYGAEVKLLEHHGWDTGLARFDNPDIATLAEGFGARSVRVRTADDVARIAVDTIDGPVLVDAAIDPDVTAHWVMLARGGA